MHQQAARQPRRLDVLRLLLVLVSLGSCLASMHASRPALSPPGSLSLQPLAGLTGLASLFPLAHFRVACRVVLDAATVLSSELFTHRFLVMPLAGWPDRGTVQPPPGRPVRCGRA